MWRRQWWKRCNTAQLLCTLSRFNGLIAHRRFHTPWFREALLLGFKAALRLPAT